MMRFAGLVSVLVALAHTAGGQVIIDHRHVDQAQSLPQSVVDAIGKQKWFFAHASLGMNCFLRRGMDGLHGADAARYPLRSQPVNPAFEREPDAPPSPTAAGTIYHWPRGQTDARGKLAMLDRAVREKGWRSPAVDVVFDKFCFIDYQANADAYLQRLAALERDYPDTVFVYATMPLLRTDRDDRPQFRDANAQTNTYNKTVRDACAKHRKILFDIADIESHDPDGKEHTYTHNGQTYPTLFTGYAQGRSNYLNDLGSRRVAAGWYALAAAIASRSDLAREPASAPPMAARASAPSEAKPPATAPARRSPRQGGSTTGMTPLCDMNAGDSYKGEDGGLYGQGRNEPPTAHAEAAGRELDKIRPLDAEGKPSPGGKIVLLSLGMSNTSQEFAQFKEIADRDPAKQPDVVVVNGAFGGMDVTAWAENRAGRWGTPWEGAQRQLKRAGVTPQQVQVLWLKQAKMGPAQWGEFPAHARKLADGTVTILNMARERYPNLRVAYLSSRIYAGYATTSLNPEPYAYESGFSVRWLIQEQIKGNPKLNYDSAKGPVKSPLLLWGPYLWADGTTPRKSDGLVWQRGDLAGDGTHPSRESGAPKVGRMLLQFFQTNPLARPWYRAPD